MDDIKPVNIKDVAKQANVALATVDRVLHDRSGVSQKTKNKVLKVIKELNYQPNFMASNLSKRKTFIIGAIFPSSSERSSYWELPVKGIQKAISELDQYNVKLETYLYVQSDSADIRKQILKVVNSNIDGLILTPKFAQETALLLQDCKDKKRPFVFVDFNPEEENQALCSIHQPIYESGELAAQLFNYCFSEGKILIIHFKDSMDSEQIINAKVKGLLNYLKETNSCISVQKIKITNFEPQFIKNTLNKQFSEYPDIKGVFIPNSKVGLVVPYLIERGNPKPFLIGYDYLKENYEYIDNGVIDFLICQKPEEQGYQAVYKVFEHLVLKKEVQKEIIMPLDIITKNNHKYY